MLILNAVLLAHGPSQKFIRVDGSRIGSTESVRSTESAVSGCSVLSASAGSSKGGRESPTSRPGSRLRGKKHEELLRTQPSSHVGGFGLRRLEDDKIGWNILESLFEDVLGSDLGFRLFFLIRATKTSVKLEGRTDGSITFIPNPGPSSLRSKKS